MLDEKTRLAVGISIQQDSSRSSTPNTSSHVFRELALCTAEQPCWNRKVVINVCRTRTQNIAAVACVYSSTLDYEHKKKQLVLRKARKPRYLQYKVLLHSHTVAFADQEGGGKDAALSSVFIGQRQIFTQVSKIHFVAKLSQKCDTPIKPVTQSTTFSNMEDVLFT